MPPENAYSQKMESRLLKPGIAAGDLSRAIFAAFYKSDPSIGAELQDGVGSAQGDHLHVSWVCAESARMLAVEVFDVLHLHRWELSIAPMSQGRTVVSRRSIWQHAGPHDLACGPSLYSSVVQSHLDGILEDEPFVPLQEPHFLALVAAVSSPGALSVVKDDSATIANIQSEMAYWRDLAKLQHKLLQDRPERTHRVQHHGHKATPDDQPETARVWAMRDIEEWAAINSDRIIILPRAISATKRGDYENPTFLFECLELLANEYTLVKQGLEDRNAFKDKADAMGLKYGGSVDPSVAGELGDAYFVRWRGSRRFLDQHITKGSSRETRFTLRIYFTWDEVDERVVIGWMPSHLGTSQS